MTSDTASTLEEGSIAERLTRTDEWSWAKAQLRALTDSVLSIGTLPKDGDLTVEIEVRKRAVGLVQTWIETVEGTAQKHSANVKALEDHLINTHINYE